MSRYARLGWVYDVISLEAVLYRRPRPRLAELFGPMPGATVVDVGCGTGLNLAWLRRAVVTGRTRRRHRSQPQHARRSAAPRNGTVRATSCSSRVTR